MLTRWKSTIRKQKTYGVLSIQIENGNGTKILGKSGISKDEKKEETKTKKDADSGNCEWLSGRMQIKERRTIERRTAASVKAKKKRDKTKRT